MYCCALVSTLLIYSLHLEIYKLCKTSWKYIWSVCDLRSFGHFKLNYDVRVPSDGQRQCGKISNALFILYSQWRRQLYLHYSTCSGASTLSLCKNWVAPVCFRGRESRSTSELRSWWLISGASWRPEERETSSTWTGSLCSQTTGSLRLSSTSEHCDTLMHWCRHWRTVRQECACTCSSCHEQTKHLKSALCVCLPFLSGELLSSGDSREVEIRGCSIWAVELIKDRLCKLLQERDAQTFSINSAIIDFYLWPYAKQHHKEMAHIPIHHTRCVYYWRAGWQHYIQ